MYTIELHPDLPIFPATETPQSAKRGAQGIFAGSTTDGLFARAEASPKGPTNYAGQSAPPSSAQNTKDTSIAAPGDDVERHNQAARESSVESILPAWPKVGEGCLAGLEMKEEDLQDKNDFAAFSVISYDSSGKKIEENGVRVNASASG
jgi:hypothetical protein